VLIIPHKPGMDAPEGAAMRKEENTDTGDPVRRFFVRASSRTAIIYMVVGLLVVIAIVAGGREIKHHISAIESFIAKLGPLGVLAFVGLFVLATSFLMPDTVLCIIAGALFGLFRGVAAVLAGSVMAAMIQFALSHKLMRGRIQRMLSARPTLVAIQHAVRPNEFRLQLLLRMTPLNPATISYLLGAAGVRFSGFMLACLALIPNLVIEVYFGYVGRHAARLAASNVRTDHLRDLAIFGGLAVCVAVVVIVSRMAYNTVLRAVAETEKAEGLPGDSGTGNKHK
jgi:uncharacterized membrane protein YdjX (TVP38/TMEM64 family)